MTFRTRTASMHVAKAAIRRPGAIDFALMHAVRPSVTPASRRRGRYAVLVAVTIVAGLAVLLGGTFLPPAVHDALGDVLWAMIIVWWIGVAAPQISLHTRGLA